MIKKTRQNILYKMFIYNILCTTNKYFLNLNYFIEMKTKIITYIESATQTSNLENKSWKEVVDLVILPKMAGPKKTRWCINDVFMNFVAEYASDISLKDTYTATAMLEVGLQRLSCGAVLHSATPWPQPLPEEYWDYSSKWDEAHVMTEGCYNFITKAMEECLKNETTRSHALAVLFGLMEHISPDGTVAYDYYALGDFKNKAAELFTYARDLAEKYASFDELVAQYVKPNQWQKHQLWFYKNYKKIDWEKFFADTKCAEGNLFQRWNQRRSIKNQIKKG